MSPYFVLHMEELLSIYQKPYDPDCPVLCMDEGNIQILVAAIKKLNAEPGQLECNDPEYVRLGTENLFSIIEPKRGLYYVNLTEHRTAMDWAYEIKYVVDVLYPHAKKIILILDNLNTHILQSLYKAFPPEKASRIADRLEIHYTPKHGSWLNIAEIAIHVVKTECIPKRFESKEDANNLGNNLKNWQIERNSDEKPIKWSFTNSIARENLANLYDFK